VFTLSTDGAVSVSPSAACSLATVKPVQRPAVGAPPRPATAGNNDTSLSSRSATD
jgi:hypothetical protein